MRCSICHTLLQPEVERVACPQCAQVYHTRCWGELGGCATYGCQSAAASSKPAPPARVGGGWGDSKTCPACKKEITSSLLVCRCGARFPYADPLTREEYDAWCVAERRLGRQRRTLVVLFVISLLGFAAVIAGPLAGFLAYRWRKAMAGAAGTYLGLGLGSATLGAIHVLILGLLALGL